MTGVSLRDSAFEKLLAYVCTYMTVSFFGLVR